VLHFHLPQPFFLKIFVVVFVALPLQKGNEKQAKQTMGHWHHKQCQEGEESSPSAPRP
jgi:hypothetical protein